MEFQVPHCSHGSYIVGVCYLTNITLLRFMHVTKNHHTGTNETSVLETNPSEFFKVIANSLLITEMPSLYDTPALKLMIPRSTGMKERTM